MILLLTIALLAAMFIALFLCSAFFSASETALVSLSHYRLKKLMLKKKALAPMFQFWLNSPNHILTMLLIGNNTTNVAISATATAIALAVFSQVDPRIVEGAVWFLALMLILIFGDITPTILGRQFSEVLSIIVIRPVYYITRAIRPLLDALFWAVRPFAPQLFAVPARSSARMTVEEVKRLIAESNESGQLGSASTEMMQKVLALSETTIARIMTPLKDVECIDIDKRYENNVDFIDEINEIGHTRIPLIKGGKEQMAGYIYVKDIFASSDGDKPIDIKTIIRQPVFVRAKQKIAEALHEFQRKGVLLAVVKDERDRICGIITLEDVIEEIVGEILDEYDKK